MERILAAVRAALQALPETGAPRIVALDGRCAAGKTTLAARLHQRIGCNVVHMDDFFLRPAQRTEARLRQPGGNVDRERFLEEVLRPLRRGEGCTYRPYDCRTQGWKPPVRIEPAPLTIVEGAYSCHPDLWDLYDLHLFLTVSPDEQLRRIRARNGADGLEMFQNRWIPLEEAYFQAFSIEKRCEYRFSSDEIE